MTTWTVREDDLAQAGRDIVREAGLSREPFCLWLQGPLGAGKTTFSRSILRALGLPERVNVTSPTYTYVNEYQIEGKWFAHLDLYRLPKRLSPEDLGLVDSRDFVGFLVEWPEMLPDSPVLQATHMLKIEIVGEGVRQATLSKA